MKNCLVLAVIISFFGMLSCGDDNSSNVTKETITYNMTYSTYTDNNMFDLSLIMQHFIDSIKIKNVIKDKPSTSAEEYSMDTEQKQHFSSVIYTTNSFYRSYAFKDDTVYHGRVKIECYLTKNGVRIDTGEVVLDLPHIYGTKWVNESNPLEYFEILDSTRCEISIFGQVTNTTYTHRSEYLRFKDNNPITGFEFISGKTARYTKDGNNYYFVRE